MLHGRIDEFVDLGEGYDFVELSVDLSLAHAQDGAAEIRILAAGEFSRESRCRLRGGCGRVRESPPIRSSAA